MVVQLKFRQKSVNNKINGRETNETTNTIHFYANVINQFENSLTETNALLADKLDRTDVKVWILFAQEWCFQTNVFFH